MARGERGRGRPRLYGEKRLSDIYVPCKADCGVEAKKAIEAEASRRYCSMACIVREAVKLWFAAGRAIPKSDEAPPKETTLVYAWLPPAQAKAIKRSSRELGHGLEWGLGRILNDRFSDVVAEAS